MISSHKLDIVTILQGNVSYDASLNLIMGATLNAQNGSLVVAPELVLTGFDYENMDRASEFADHALNRLLGLVDNQILVFTAIVKKNNEFENEAFVLHNHKIIHRQSKSRLFTLGGEEKHFRAGRDADITPFVVNGVKYAILICFEIRFKELWKAVEGVDVVIVPAQWGVLRENHIMKLCSALAIMNQCFVVLVSSGYDGISELSQIYNPNGDLLTVDEPIDTREVAKMRRYIDMGTDKE